jgi:hypothetical protein
MSLSAYIGKGARLKNQWYKLPSRKRMVSYPKVEGRTGNP